MLTVAEALEMAAANAGANDKTVTLPRKGSGS
jgi:hypothetical protein